MINLRPIDLERFWSKVDKTDPNGCWIWTGCRTRNGYGNIKIQKINYIASRISWILENGDIPKGLFILHRCDNRRCVNFKHLFLGTAKDNTLDCIKKNRFFIGELVTIHKLTEKQVRQIRQEYIQNINGYIKLGKKYGVSTAAIRNIIKLKSWKHIV